MGEHPEAGSLRLSLLIGVVLALVVLAISSLDVLRIGDPGTGRLLLPMSAAGWLVLWLAPAAADILAARAIRALSPPPPTLRAASHAALSRMPALIVVVLALSPAAILGPPLAVIGFAYFYIPNGGSGNTDFTGLALLMTAAVIGMWGLTLLAISDGVRRALAGESGFAGPVALVAVVFLPLALIAVLTLFGPAITGPQTGGAMSLAIAVTALIAAVVYGLFAANLRAAHRRLAE